MHRRTIAWISSVVVFLCFISGAARAQPGPGGGVGSAPPEHPLMPADLRTFSPSLWNVAFGRPFVQYSSVLLLSPTAVASVQDVYEARFGEDTSALSPQAAVAVDYSEPIPLPWDPSEIASAGLQGFTLGALSGELLTDSGYSCYIYGLDLQVEYQDGLDIARSMRIFFPLGTELSMEAASARAQAYVSVFVAPEYSSGCPGVSPTSGVGKWCACLDAARDELINDSLRNGGIAIPAGGACLVASVSCGPLAVVCAPVCAVGTLIGFIIAEVVEIRDFCGDKEECDAQLCVDDPPRCPPPHRCP